MKNYTNYCTEEQTKRAYKLGAPIRTFECDNKIARESFIKRFDAIELEGIVMGDIPTTQQMIGWLREEKKINITIRNFGNSYRYSVSTFINGMDVSIYFENNYMGYKQAELEAIDVALNYLEK